MRGLLVAATVASIVLVAAAGTCRADVFADNWLRGASSTAVNDDATALFINPAGLGMYSESDSYVSLSMSGEDVSGFSASTKMGPLGVGYSRQYLWEPDGDKGLRPGDDAMDVYYAGLALGDPRSFAFGIDYRWFRQRFGDEKKSGTWDVGVMYRPTPFLSVGGAVRNISEPDGLMGEPDREDCDCGSKTTYVVGAAVRPMGNRLTLMADAALDRDEDMENAIYTAGVEAELADGVVARGSLQSYPVGDDREQEWSAGVWFNTTYAGVGASYRSFEAGASDVMTYGVSTTDHRQRTVFRARGKVAEIKVSGPLSDFRPGWSLLGEPRKSSQSILREIRRAAESGTVECILLNIKPLGGSFLGGPSALVQEIRDEVVRVRAEHGVKVVAYLEYGAGTPEYFLATAADRIMIHPSTGIEGIGNYVTVNRFTGTTEKVGVEWDYMSAGKYKSTFHSYGPGPLTDEQRVEVQSLTDAVYEEIIAAVMEGREMSRTEAEELCDGRLFIPRKAIEVGLVDAEGTYEDAKAAATELAGNDVPDDLEDISTVSVAHWHPKDYDWGAKPVIAVVGAYGGIHEGEGGTDPLRGGQSIGSETLVKSLRAARKDPKVKAVVLRVDSGGGSGLASDIIWRETIKVAKAKPFIVSMGDIAGSGGYYIAIEGEKIFVEPLTITGSIGVVGMKPVIAELYEKIDATHETFRSAEHADQWSVMRRLTDEELEMANEAINWFYDDFVEKAAESRGMTEERLRELAEGRVYMGSQALENGLVDEEGGLSAAIDYACERLGTDRKDASVVYYREGWSFMDTIAGAVATRLGLWRLLDFGDAGMNDLLGLKAIQDPTLLN